MNLSMRGLARLVSNLLLTTLAVTVCAQSADDTDKGRKVRKIRDFIIYEDPSFYAAFPSVIKNEDGEIIVAFRRAPDRKVFCENGTRHIAGSVLEIKN